MSNRETFWRVKYAQKCTAEFQDKQTNPFVGRGPTQAPPDRPPLATIQRPIPLIQRYVSDFPDDAPQSEKADDLLVGIIGAGAAGLYTAMILDDLGIKYEILEGSNRAGGRIRTHRFSGTNQWNYFVSLLKPSNPGGAHRSLLVMILGYRGYALPQNRHYVARFQSL